MHQNLLTSIALLMYVLIPKPNNNNTVLASQEALSTGDNESVIFSNSEVYLLWMSGVRMVIEGSVLTYNGTGGFKYVSSFVLRTKKVIVFIHNYSLSGRFVYWLFVFCVSVVFAAILIAQFETSYNQLADKANLNVILKKTDFMKKIDRVLFTFCWIFKHTPCVRHYYCIILCFLLHV